MGSLSALSPPVTPLDQTAIALARISPSTNPNQAKVHRVAKQFEAMFMSEMLHQAHPKPEGSGTFRPGYGETAMQPFMDQALGDAVAARGGLGLAQAIERTLNAASTGKNQ